MDRLPYLLLLPCLVIIGVLLLWPLGQVVVMSFYQLNNVRQLRGDREWPWVGFGNYAEILCDPFFLTVLRNTVLFAVGERAAHDGAGHPGRAAAQPARSRRWPPSWPAA